MEKLWKNTITVEVIGTGERPYFKNLQEVAYATDQGDCSGKWDQGVTFLSLEDFLDACDDHCTDPEFFFGEDFEETDPDRRWARGLE